jgi:hypothetical protein
MNDIQALLDTIRTAMRDTRKDYHVSLGELIRLLDQADPETLIYYTNPHSYRGYYHDLAIEPTDLPIKVFQLNNQLKQILDKELYGYKGGEYLMSADTPVWIAHKGCTGAALVAFDPTTLTLTTKETR